jgi:DNA repair protein RadC
VLAHNHPSGSINPSSQDREITKRLLLAAGLFDMDILDHIIIGDTGKYFSFAEEGLMEILRREARETLS